MPVRVRFKKRPRQPTFVRQWRVHRGLTQEQLAERLRMSAAQLSRIETGKQPYTQDFLEAAAEELGVELASLLMRDPLKEDPNDPNTIWSLWDQAKPGQRRMIVDIAKTVTKTGT
jgi:transcriptional regulator with XRE-family HTH domain